MVIGQYGEMVNHKIGGYYIVVHTDGKYQWLICVDQYLHGY